MATTTELWLQQNSAKQRQLNNLANAEYWAKRERQQRELYMMEEAQQQRELEKIYAEMYRYAEDEINRFYGKYADAEGIDITEAKKRVTQADIEAYEALAKEYVKNKDFSDRANAEMRLYNATMKINRLEMLKARIGVHLVAGVNDIDDYYEKVVTDRTRQEIERQAGILGETVSVADTTKRAENIVNASFFNATYSERIWSNMDNLRSEISIQLQRGLIAGVGSREMARRVKEYAYDKSLSDAHRLMVTELRRVQTDVAMESYRQSGVERYVYLAVNPRACPICRRLNGKDYAVEGAEVANEDHPLPPMHPRCHCTTAPYVEEDDYNAWLNYLSQGGRTSDWNNLSPAERQKWLAPVVQSALKNWSRDDVEWSRSGKSLQKRLEVNGVQYRQVEEWESQPTEKAIINRLAGGDKTKGSCFSLACAYVANKHGLNVLDFRGGASQDVFAGGYRNIVRLNGVNAKEYMLCTGRHASMVKKEDGKYYYLELQSANESGWQPFEREYQWGNTTIKYSVSDTLKNRFGCTGYTIAESFLLDPDSLKGSDEFRDLLGYVNTAEDAQKKGRSGSVK